LALAAHGSPRHLVLCGQEPQRDRSPSSFVGRIDLPTTRNFAHGIRSFPGRTRAPAARLAGQARMGVVPVVSPGRCAAVHRSDLPTDAHFLVGDYGRGSCHGGPTACSRRGSDKGQSLATAACSPPHTRHQNARTRGYYPNIALSQCASHLAAIVQRRLPYPPRGGRN